MSHKSSNISAEDDYLMTDYVDDDHRESDNWTVFQDLQENFIQLKCGKIRNYRKQKKKRKDVESRTSAMQHKNTLDAIIFNEMCDKADKESENDVKEDSVREGSRKSKRSFKTLRSNERDSKLDLGINDQYEYSKKHCCIIPKIIKIETKNRFRCLRSKPVDNEAKTNKLIPQISICKSNLDQQNSFKSPSLQDREIFHSTFSLLIRLGSSDKDKTCKRQISQEETRWQNELKDIIWLELQAYKSDLSPMLMDEYLCKQREGIGALLDEIMAYKFDPITNTNGDTASGNSSQIKLHLDYNLCNGCLSMYCRDCTRNQSEALKQIESMLSRLESAEALFPSSQAFASHYPLYKSSEFTGRVKAMCLWYNITKHHRLKLIILGRLLTLLHRNKKQDDNYLSDSGISSRASDSTSPSDSNNSNSSSASSVISNVSHLTFGESSISSATTPTSPELSLNNSENDRLERLELYLSEFDRQVYRKYIEEVLKTRGLRKSLNFLESLHTSVLRKARLALEKPSAENVSSHEEYEGDEELRRYGVWSAEAKDLNLPSYRAAFVFLSRVPLDVINEFLRIRIEQKPDQPSPLSVRQLMRELREGLRIACIHRARFAKHSLTAAACDGPCTALFDENVKDFDKSLKTVFQLYLDYLQQWVELVHYDSFHKNLIQDEWNFVKSIAGKISDGNKIAAHKFCEIVKIMIVQINEFITERPQELRDLQFLRSEEGSSSKSYSISVGREWQTLFTEIRDKVVKSVALAKSLKDDIQNFPEYNVEYRKSVGSLMKLVTDLKYKITEVIVTFQRDIDEIYKNNSESDLMLLRVRVREILHHAYRMGFEYYKDLCRHVYPENRSIIVKDLMNFALLWMNFVKIFCERGRGLRPRWANQGLEFLITVCEPVNTKHLTEEEFESLKTSMDHCISHVVGSTAEQPTETDKGSTAEQSTDTTDKGSRATSPHCRSSTVSAPQLNVSAQSKASSASNDDSLTLQDGSENSLCRQERLALAVKNLECKMEQKLRNRELIGHVVDRKSVNKIKIKARRVNFTWQRGIKIGQGRFGKVYTVVNNQTGELLAMKEVQLQPGDCNAIKQVAEELQIFEGIQHKHLVRYYGVEIHREEMLLFMEFCAEGTLESLIVGSGNGLPELLLRKYTHQLLAAVSMLHSHGIVHRDIKTANIFLTDEGNCLKLGDFGSAVQIKAHTTVPGEVKGYVGTQAYMAPEVFMKTESAGHGRAADIWSVGCCVVEMASGKRPWSEFDSNYQIMFKVGMGESPQPPKHLSPEGVNFVSKCLEQSPKKRATASNLLTHTFARAYEDVNTDLVNR